MFATGSENRISQFYRFKTDKQDSFIQFLNNQNSSTPKCELNETNMKIDRPSLFNQS